MAWGSRSATMMTTQFEPQDLEIQMKVKDVFDPGWLLNPAKVFPLAASEARRKRPVSPSDGADPCEGGRAPLALPRAYFWKE